MAGLLAIQCNRVSSNWRPMPWQCRVASTMPHRSQAEHPSSATLTPAQPTTVPRSSRATQNGPGSKSRKVAKANCSLGAKKLGVLLSKTPKQAARSSGTYDSIVNLPVVSALLTPIARFHFSETIAKMDLVAGTVVYEKHVGSHPSQRLLGSSASLRPSAAPELRGNHRLPAIRYSPIPSVPGHHESPSWANP